MQRKEFITNLNPNNCNIHGISQNLKKGDWPEVCVLKGQSDSYDCQLTWESRWEEGDSAKTHVFVVGEDPFLEEIAADRIRRYKIPMFQRFCLTRSGVLAGFRVADKDALVGLDEEHRLEIVGQLVKEKLLFLFQFNGKWSYEFLDPSTLASYLKHAGLSQVGTLYLMASKLGAGSFLPAFAHELTCRGIQYGALCGPEGFVYRQQHSARPKRRKIRVICEEKDSPLLKQNVVSKLGPMLRECGPEFDYEVIVQVGEDPAVVEAVGVLVGNSPFRTCWIKWCPSRGDWRVLYGEPRFLRLNTRWVVVAQSAARFQMGSVDLFGGLEAPAFAIRFLRLLHAFETWQEVHGKLSHLLLVGANLFRPEEKAGFTSKLAREFATLGCLIQIRVRGFVHQKDIVGCLRAGWLTSESPFLNWTFDSPIWERDLNWNMGQLISIDAPVCEPESPFRRLQGPSLAAWEASLGSDLTWISGSVVATRWRERIGQALAEIFPRGGNSCNLVPVLEAAAISDEPNLLWIDVSNGGVLRIGACPACLREFENYFQNLSEDLFGAFLVDGDFYLQRRVGVSSQLYDAASRAALALLVLIRPKKDSPDYFEKGLAVRLCSEFLKNLGEKTSDRQGILARAWRGVSRNYESAWLSVASQERAILGTLSGNLDDYETARAYQFSAPCIQTSPPVLCWRDFLDPVICRRTLLGNACERLSERNRALDFMEEREEVEEYFEKIDAARKNSVGSFQNTPEGTLWTPPLFAVILEVDLRTPWVCFGSHFLYSSVHTGRDEVKECGMPFVQVDQAAQLPFPVWSRILALDLWSILGGSAREPLPIKPDIVVLPILPLACVSYEWGPCNSEPNFSPNSVLRKIAETGRFHPVYREFDSWHGIHKLHFDALPTVIEIFLALSTKLLIFPDAGLPSHVCYHIHGAGGAYRCLVRRGFIAEIECEVTSESWIFESADDAILKVTKEGVEGDNISIRFIGPTPQKISICTKKLGLSKEIYQLLPRGASVKVSPSHPNLPGISLGVFGNLQVRFDTKARLLRTFCPKSLKPLGPLKTIYAQTTDRFDRVGIHDGNCFAVEYLLSLNGGVLELTYRLNSFGWALVIVSTDISSFFTELKTAQRIRCPLDEFLLRWLNTEKILGMEESEEEGILPQLSKIILICSKSKSSISPLWIRTEDNVVIWQGKCTSPVVGDSQMILTTLDSEDKRFLFQREGKVFYKNGWDTWMFPIHEGERIKHFVREGRWIISSQSVYSLTTVPLQIGWKNTGSLSKNDLRDLVLYLGDKLRHPMLGVAIKSPHLLSEKMVFIDTAEKVIFPSPFQNTEKEGWFLGRENYEGGACWWSPQDHRVICTSHLSSLWSDENNLLHVVRPPFREAVTGAGIADGFLHLRTYKGNVYRRLSNGSWLMIQVRCSGECEGEIFCEIANAIKDYTISVLPLELSNGKEMRRVGWFLRRTSQIVNAPLEAGSKAILLGCSDGDYHYVFGENRIFEWNGSTWRCQGQACFALRKNGVLFLIVDHIADPPILDTQKLVLVGLWHCTRWKLGDGLRSYQLIVLESGNGVAISGILDLRPLCRQDCGCWIHGEDVVIAEWATGHLLVIRNGKCIVSADRFFGDIQIRFAEFENCITLQDFLNAREQ